jgi:hypothetical protein
MVASSCKSGAGGRWVGCVVRLHPHLGGRNWSAVAAMVGRVRMRRMTRSDRVHDFVLTFQCVR